MPSKGSSEAGGVTPRLRSALAAIGNAEAVGTAREPGRKSATSTHFAGATAGLGSAEVPRRSLSETEIQAIVCAEITDRQAAARQYDELGRGEEAQRLRREANALAAALDGPG
ncbi:MAG: hypothetical protein ACLQFR_20325 [Streptosporangiaceae bacterium]